MKPFRILGGAHCPRLLLFLFAVVFSANRLQAQATTGDIVGTVTDSTGSAIPDAKVIALDTDTNITREVKTGGAGGYTFSQLQVGHYRVMIEAPNFKQSKVDGLELAAGDRQRVDVKLEVGGTSEVVEVQAAESGVQTDSSSVGTLLSTEQVQDIPLNGRNFISLVSLTPGVTPGATGGSSQPLTSGSSANDRRQSSAFSANGQDPGTNNNLIDGADNNDRIIGGIGVRPSIDAIAEVKIDTNLYRAEVGRTAGGVVNLIIKSGTNHFHGTVYEYLRNDLFDANPFWNFQSAPKALIPAKPEFRQNQFGGSLGGPIYKDKTFFFVDFEALRIVQGSVVSGLVVPTALQRVGDFSEACTTGFNSAGVCADSTKQLSLTAAMGSAPAGPIPFNRLNVGPYVNQLDPIGLKMAALYPLPQTTGISSANYTAVKNHTYNSRLYDIKVDHHFSPAHAIWARYTYNLVNTFIPTDWPDTGDFNPGSASGGVGGSNPGPNVSGAMNGALDYTYIITPNLLLDLRASYLRNSVQSLDINYGKNVSTELGFPCNAVSCINTGDPQTYGLPQTAPLGFGNLGESSYTPLIKLDNSFQYMGSLTWTRGRHTMKAGGGVIRRQFNITNSGSPTALLLFYPNSASYFAPISGASLAGAGMASLEVGVPIEMIRSLTPFEAGYRAWENSGFLQDDWRASSKLTVNLGLRYDVFTPIVEKYGRIGNLNIFTGQVLAPKVNSNPTTGITTAYNNLAPRFGFAYSIDPKTVVRGGYGISFFLGDINSNGLLKNPPYSPALSCGSATGTPCSAFGPFGTLSQGEPVPSVTVAAATTPAGLSSVQIAPSSTFSIVDQGFKPSYIEQFNLLLERGYRQYTLSAGYVGSVGRHLAVNLPDVNRALPSGTSTPNPRTISSVLNPNVGAVTDWLSQATSSYNALQVSLQRHAAGGLDISAGYTYAKALDDVGGNGIVGTTGGFGTYIGPQSQIMANVRSYDYGPTEYDIKHRTFVAVTWKIPYGSSLRGVSAVALRGWQLNGVLTTQSGLPYTLTNSTAQSGILGLTSGDRPDRVKQKVKAASTGFGVNHTWLDTTAFAAQKKYTVGNSSRGVGYGPGATLLNSSVFKSFKIYRETNLEFRAESFNTLNHPTFSNPATSLGGANFGQIISLAQNSQPRQIQFALKLLF